MQGRLGKSITCASKENRSFEYTLMKFGTDSKELGCRSKLIDCMSLRLRTIKEGNEEGVKPDSPPRGLDEKTDGQGWPDLWYVSS